MDYCLMGQMIRGRAFYVENPTLSEFPVGEFRTPGFGGAHRLYTIFEPFYETDKSQLTIPKQVAIEEKAAEKTEHKNRQQGFGQITKNEIEQHNEPLKRKLTEDIFYKMQHPIYKTTKVKHARFEIGEPSTSLPAAPPVKASTAPASETSGSGHQQFNLAPKKVFAPPKKEKLYCKF